MNPVESGNRPLSVVEDKSERVDDTLSSMARFDHLLDPDANKNDPRQDIDSSKKKD